MASTPQPCMPCFSVVVAFQLMGANSLERLELASTASQAKNTGKSQLVAVLSADTAACFSALLTALLFQPPSASWHTPCHDHAHHCALGLTVGRLLVLLAALLQCQPPMHALLGRKPCPHAAGTAASSFFALLADLLQDQVSASHVVATGGVAVLLHHILQHVDAFCCQEHGAALRLTSILRPAGEGADFKGSPTSG